MDDVVDHQFHVAHGDVALLEFLDDLFVMPKEHLEGIFAYKVDLLVAFDQFLSDCHVVDNLSLLPEMLEELERHVLLMRQLLMIKEDYHYLRQ
mgnify:CR=1 FL=1